MGEYSLGDLLDINIQSICLFIKSYMFVNTFNYIGMVVIVSDQNYNLQIKLQTLHGEIV